MENLYRLNEYPGKLPNPKHFPISGATIIAVKYKPYTFADGFMLDLSVRERDKVMLEGRAERVVDSLTVLVEGGKRSELLLSEPEFIYDTTYVTYILFTPSGNPIAIQVKYYKYFKNRYPECKFYKNNEASMLITIKVDKEVVGLCMPLLLERETITKIKEEGK